MFISFKVVSNNEIKFKSHLIVSVGEGQGLQETISWGSGMLILRECTGCFFLGVVTATGGGGATASSINDWNWILMFVLGNRKMHLVKKYNINYLTAYKWFYIDAICKALIT